MVSLPQRKVKENMEDYRIYHQEQDMGYQGSAVWDTHKDVVVADFYDQHYERRRLVRQFGKTPAGLMVWRLIKQVLDPDENRWYTLFNHITVHGSESNLEIRGQDWIHIEYHTTEDSVDLGTITVEP